MRIQNTATSHRTRYLIAWVVIAVMILFAQKSSADGSSDMGTMISQVIQKDLNRQLLENGAIFESLNVSMAKDRSEPPHFLVQYQGMSEFSGDDGKKLQKADGRFFMNYVGGGQYRGTLEGTKFTVQLGKVDNIDLPFVNDPQALGNWVSVDFVPDKSAFNPDHRSSNGKLFLPGFTFLPDGRTQFGWYTWTKGVVIHHGDKTAAKYEIREIKGKRYMFLEWKTGDVMFFGRPPKYYVLAASSKPPPPMEIPRGAAGGEGHNPRADLADMIQKEVAKSLAQAGAKCDQLDVPITIGGGIDTPYVVHYQGLTNFTSTDGTKYDKATGEFAVSFIGNGIWQGTLGGTRFTVTAHKPDDLNLKFVNDPEVLGTWKSVDFVTDPKEFIPGQTKWEGDLFLKSLTFLDGGKMPKPTLSWTKGDVINHVMKTASHYQIKQINGAEYMFLEWKSGDVTILGMKPSYYVLKKAE